MLRQDKLREGGVSPFQQAAADDGAAHKIRLLHGERLPSRCCRQRRKVLPKVHRDISRSVEKR